MAPVSRRLIMAGPAAEARGAVADVVQAYREGGLFRRWPIDYVATRGGLRGFIAHIARERSPVVHLHVAPQTAPWREATFAAIALGARCPLILHLHERGFELGWALERAACVVVPCESLRAWVASVTPNARVVCVPSPVPLPEAAPVERPSLVVFMSGLGPQSGAAELVEAVAGVRRAVPDVRLVVASGDDQRSALERHAERLGVEDAVKFTGWVGPSGRRALLESAAVFALPSYHAALPMSVLQAMAAGVPVVATSVGGLPEVITDGVTGFLVPAGDTASLQRALRKLLLDRVLGARIGAAARESVRLRFAPERALPRLEAVYAAVGLCAVEAAPGPLRDLDAKGAA